MHLLKRPRIIGLLTVWLVQSGAPRAAEPVHPPAPELKAAVTGQVERELPGLIELYRHLHEHPELSFQESKTAAHLASLLERRELKVTRAVGGHGLVAVARNGEGPTVLIRADMDALPVKEQTGLEYASAAMATDDQGNEVPVMHACGHDVHMTCLIGTAGVLMSMREAWHGTLVLIAQPAEERGAGARAMIEDGLFTRYPVPDYALALHVAHDLPAGVIGYVPGFAMANVDSVDILVRGVGGHGAFPHTTKDPIVLSAQIVLALQSIVSREIAPTEPAVVTVGSIHGGSKHNIIPEEVRMQLTLRSFTDEVRAQTLAAIRRITRGLGEAAGLPEDRLPQVTVKDEFTPASYHDPELTMRLAAVWRGWLGEGNVLERKPVMGGEDFGQYGRTEHQVPICMFGLGAIDPQRVQATLAAGARLPSLHSSLFAPDAPAAVRTGVTAMSAAALDLFGKPK